LLPLAQQTRRVGGSQEEGTNDGSDNASALIAALGADTMAAQGDSFLMFLDVEGVGLDVSLSQDYYTGWATALQAKSQELSGGRFTILPCVYARAKDNVTWNALLAADAAGVKCFGAWVARFLDSACDNGFVDWNSVFAEPTIGLPFEVLIWQFAQNCPSRDGIDCNQTVPDIDGDGLVMKRLVAP
jgi:hypothetical protein